MSLLKDCLNLNHHSLQSYILEQTTGDEAYKLLQLNQHPQFNTISQKINSIWKIFCSQTYRSGKQKKIIGDLNEKQIKCLKEVSVLCLFQGKNAISVGLLCQQLELDCLGVYKLLTQMSSKGLVNVKIDDKNKMCAILAAKRRRTMGVNKASLAAQCEARLTQILASNNSLIKQISKNQ